MSERGDHRPRCRQPSGLVRPVRLDQTGADGPTRSRAQGPGWRATGRGFYVPAGTDSTSVEQRIMEASAHAGPRAVVTGWASLRLHRGGFFDGLASDGKTTLPVPVISPSATRARAGTCLVWTPLVDGEVTEVAGIRCTTPERAVVDEVLRRGELRAGVAVIDMACAGELTSLRRQRNYLGDVGSRRGLGLVRRCLRLAVEDAWSPREVDLRLIWLLDAGLQPPLCNQRVWSTRGDLIGVPDIFDSIRGIAGEYEGEHHRDRSQHRADVARSEGFLAHGIEVFTMVAGDSVDTVVERIDSAIYRAAGHGDDPRRWTLEPPPDAPIAFHQPLSLDAKLDTRDLAREYADRDDEPPW